MKSIKLIIFLAISLQSKAQIDKVYHFGAGMIIGQMTFPYKPKKSIIISTIAGLTIGTAKEYYDYRTKGKYEVNDILATTTGALVGSLTTIVIKRLIKF